MIRIYAIGESVARAIFRYERVATRHFPSGHLPSAANDEPLMSLVREKRLRALLYLAQILLLVEQAEQVRELVHAPDGGAALGAEAP